MSGSIMQERLASIYLSNATDDGTNIPFHLITPDTSPLIPDLSTDAGRKEISNFARRWDIKLIVIDNISSLCRSSGYSENDAESWNGIQAWAVDMRSNGVSIIFVHHAGKNGQQRGTSKREDVMDIVIGLKPVKNVIEDDVGARFEIQFEKTRGVYGDAVKPIRAELRTNSRGIREWSVSDAVDPKIAEVARMRNEGKSFRVIGDELGISKSQAERISKKVVENA